MENINYTVLSGGLVIGLIFGVVMQRSRFCMVAAVSNAFLIRDFRYAQAFIAAWIIAVLGVSLLESFSLVAISDSGYRSGGINWLGAIGGGLVFGFGASLAGGCAARTLVNTAEGNLGALLALLTMMMLAGVTTYGALEPLRMNITSPTTIAIASGDTGISSLLHIPAWFSVIVFVFAGLGLIVRLGSIRENLSLIVAGAIIGLLVVFAWLVNGWLSVDEFTAVKASAIAITGPLAKANLLLATGSGSMFNFGFAFLVGLFIGALLSAISSGGFSIKISDAKRNPHNLIGGALMGFGATLAGGCNIGQGLSGVSTLSITSILAATAMFGGAALGLKWWERHV